MGNPFVGFGKSLIIAFMVFAASGCMTYERLSSQYEPPNQYGISVVDKLDLTTTDNQRYKSKVTEINEKTVIGKSMFGNYIEIPFEKIQRVSVRAHDENRTVMLTTVVLAVALVVYGGIKFMEGFEN